MWIRLKLLPDLCPTPFTFSLTFKKIARPPPQNKNTQGLIAMKKNTLLGGSFIHRSKVGAPYDREKNGVSYNSYK